MKLIRTLAAALLGTLALTGLAQTEPGDPAAVPAREHRAIWMTPLLSNNWPSSAITESNATGVRRTLKNIIKRLGEMNINVIYYHARVNCGTLYPSKYEPWSAAVSGQRGKEPPFDPFAALLEEAHANGIEVYAWINPYRYHSSLSKTPYGGGDENYENSHPEWLIYSKLESVLNPAIPEVQQRVLDIISEIVTGYDIDGVVFDDYFYGQGGTDMSQDAEQYNAYKAPLGNKALSQADWRRNNVNTMVARCKETIKKLKPWVVFAIGPAGVSSPTNIQSEYGLEPYSGLGDFQYNGIYCDPLAWLKAQTIDFISPQIYWPSHFNGLSDWWQNAAAKFGRPCYPSVDISDLSSVKTQEFINEVEHSRANSPAGQAGIVYFQYDKYINYYEKIFGKNQMFGYNMQQACYPTKALTPLRPWENSFEPRMTANVTVADGNLIWDALDNVRYVVYAHQKSAEAPFVQHAADRRAIVYTNSYELPKDYADYDWYVSVYDRFNNEYGALGVGMTAGEGKPVTLTYPADGESPVDLFRFSWDAAQQAGARSILEVSTDADFSTLIAAVETDGNAVSVAGLPKLTTGKTYYWRVRTIPVGAAPALSAARSFVAPHIALTAPAANASEVSLTPTLTWSAAAEGAKYKVEISRVSNFSTIIYEAETDTPEHTVPACKLSSGRTYYARVTATLDNASSQSDVVTFSTLNRNDYEAPVLLTPSKDGQTVYRDDVLEVKPYEGLSSVTISVSTSASFPARTGTTNRSLSNFETKDSGTAGSLRISGKNLVAGTTYYIRTRGAYSLTTSTATQYTPWSPTLTFVYSSEAGVNDIVADDDESVRLDGLTLVATAGTAVTVCAPNGMIVLDTVSDGRTDLSGLAPGLYIVRAADKALKFRR